MNIYGQIKTCMLNNAIHKDTSGTRIEQDRDKEALINQSKQSFQTFQNEKKTDILNLRVKISIQQKSELTQKLENLQKGDCIKHPIEWKKSVTLWTEGPAILQF